MTDDLKIKRDKAKANCVDFCITHNARLYLVGDNTLYIVFDKIRDAILWSDEMPNLMYTEDDVYLESEIYVTCESVIRTIQEAVQLR